MGLLDTISSYLGVGSSGSDDEASPTPESEGEQCVSPEEAYDDGVVCTPEPSWPSFSGLWKYAGPESKRPSPSTQKTTPVEAGQTVAGSRSCEDDGPGEYLSAVSEHEVEDGLAPDGILPKPEEGVGIPLEQRLALEAGYFPHEAEVVFDPKGKKPPVVKKKAAPKPEPAPLEVSLQPEPSSAQPALSQALPVKKTEASAHRSKEAPADRGFPEVRIEREAPVSLGPIALTAAAQTVVRDEKIEAPLVSPLGAPAGGVPSGVVSGPVLDRAASAAPSIDHALVEGPVFLVDRGTANLVSHSQPSPDDRDAGGVETVFFAHGQSSEPVPPNLLSSLALAGERTEGDLRAGLTDSGGEGGGLSPRPVIGSAPEPEGRGDSSRGLQVRGEERAAEGTLASVTDRPVDPLSAVSNLFSFPSLDGREPWSAPLSPTTSPSALSIAALLREYGPTAALTGNTSAVTQSIAGTQGAVAAARSLYTPYAAPSGARAPAGAGTVLAEAVNGTTSGSSLGDGAAGGQSQGNTGGGSDRDSRDPDRAPVLPA